jgi:RND family efflux transporter MFP subunit
MADRLQSHPARAGRRALIAGAIALGLLALVIAILWRPGIEPGLLIQISEPIPNQPLGVVLSQDVPMLREVIGSVQPRVPVEAASRVAARVIAVKVRAGDRVAPGQVLVALDASELRNQVAQAQGELAAAQAELRRATADEQRFAALFARGSVTAREHDAAEAAYRSAAARAAQARAAVASARAGLEYATVRSPVGGIIVERLVEPGDMAMPGKPLLRLYDENALRVELEVPEDLARNLDTGTPLTVRVDAIGATYRTQVDEIVPATDPSSRSFLVRASLPSGRHLRPGMFARATLEVGSEKILTVPRAALEHVGQLEAVRVYSKGRVQTRMVSLGRSFDDRIEVLAGLRKDERVLLLDAGTPNR